MRLPGNRFRLELEDKLTLPRDAEGKVTSSNQPVNVTEPQFEEVLKTFIGEIEQTPPPYSAVKVQGRKAYEMARKGEEVELEPRKITVHHLEVLEWAPPEVVIDVFCSSGTYVRSLANDLGRELGVGAHLVGLRRTKSGRFTLFLVVVSGFFFLYNQVYNVMPLYVKRVVETSPAMDLYTAAMKFCALGCERRT